MTALAAIARCSIARGFLLSLATAQSTVAAARMDLPPLLRIVSRSVSPPNVCSSRGKVPYPCDNQP